MHNTSKKQEILLRAAYLFAVSANGSTVLCGFVHLPMESLSNNPNSSAGEIARESAERRTSLSPGRDTQNQFLPDTYPH